MPSRAPILFIHGMYLTGRSWRGWARAYEARGHVCLTPSWPGRDGDATTCRSNPSPELETLTLGALVDQYQAVAEGLSEAPVLLGHSMGGLIVQLLLARGVGRAGVALCSAPPRGVRSLAWSHLKANAPVLWPTRKPIVLSEAQWKSAFWHTGGAAEVKEAYDNEVVAESRLVGRGPVGAEAAIEFGRARPPLLFVSGAEDRIIPPALNRDNADRYRRSGLEEATELWEIPGRTHFIAGQPGWEEVCERVHGWIAQQLEDR